MMMMMIMMMFSRKDFFRLFDGLLRISTRKTNAEPTCLTSLGGQMERFVQLAKHLELVHAHHLANPFTDLGNHVLIKLVCYALTKTDKGTHSYT